MVTWMKHSRQHYAALAILISIVAVVFLTETTANHSFTMQHSTTVSNKTQLAAPVTAASYGEQLGQTIDDVVNTIHATVNGALITHADVLAILCMEQGGANRNLRATITSHAGAKGLTQVMPGTFAQYRKSGAGGFGHLNCSYSHIQTNPRCSIEAGARIFNELLMRYKGNRTTAARAYNGGPGRAYGGNLPAETRNYAYVKLPQCLNAIVKSRSPVKSSVWQSMIQKVSKITNGTFRLLGSGKLVPLGASGWPLIASSPEGRFTQITGLPFPSSSGSNAFSRFLGIPQSPSSGSSSGGSTYPSINPNDPRLLPENDPSQRLTDTAQKTESPSLLERNTPSANDTENSAASNTDTASNDNTSGTATTATATNTQQPTESAAIEDRAPILLCLPSIVDEDEEAIVMYTCRDGSQTATLTANTSESVVQHNDPLGTLRVSPEQVTAYTVSCSEGTSAQCTIRVADPALAIVATPKNASRGQTVRLSWKTKDTNTCVVTSNDTNHKNWEKTGTEGDVVTPTLIQDTTFSLTCETTTGHIEDRSVRVGVN